MAAMVATAEAATTAALIQTETLPRMSAQPPIRPAYRTVGRAPAAARAIIGRVAHSHTVPRVEREPVRTPLQHPNDSSLPRRFVGRNQRQARDRVAF